MKFHIIFVFFLGLLVSVITSHKVSKFAIFPFGGNYKPTKTHSNLVKRLLSEIDQLTKKTVTNVLIYTNLIVFFFQRLHPSIDYKWILQINPLVKRGEYHRLLFSFFGHGSFVHIGSNMIGLFYYGRIAEPKLGESV